MSAQPSGARAAVAAVLISSMLSAAYAAAPDEDIRDIRGLKYVFPQWVLLAVSAGAVLLLAVSYAVWRWRRKRRPAPLLPFEIALQRLEALRTLMQPTRAREFSTAASDIVRGYIEQRFDVTVTRRTTEEFLRELLQSSSASLARHQGLLGEFLYQCDFVKFAASSLTTQNMETLLQSARTFVLETAKPEEAAATGEARDSLPAT